MKRTFSLILLLILAFSLIIYYAFIKTPPKIIGDWEFRQLKIDFPWIDHESDEDTVILDNEGMDIIFGEESFGPDTLPQTILLIGDSMAGPISYRVRDYATGNGHTLTTVCWCSSSTYTWANTDTLRHFIELVNPTHIFICLGSNQLFIRDLDRADREIKSMLNTIGEIPAVWIGPPNWKNDTGINDLILKNMGSDSYYPSKNLTFQRISDGMHPTVASAANWFDSVAVWITRGNSCHTIKLDVPDIQGIQKMYYLKPPTN